MVPEEPEATEGSRQPAASYTVPDTDQRVSASGTKAVPRLRHEAILEWRYSSMHSEPCHYDEMNGQLHASAVLSFGKEPVSPVVHEDSWTPSQRQM